MGEYALNIKSLPNPKLKWEKTATLNAGVDFVFWKNKINGSFEYYYKKTSFNPAWACAWRLDCMNGNSLGGFAAQRIHGQLKHRAAVAAYFVVIAVKKCGKSSHSSAIQASC